MMRGAMPHRLVHLVTCPSTNALARERVESGAWRDDVAVWTDAQTAGRGTRGRRWITPPERGLALSVVVDARRLSRSSRLTVLAGVAVRRALVARGRRDVSLKWPNDVMRDDRKVGGILIEAARAPDGTRLHVVGVGLNLALRDGDVPDELAETVGDVDLDTSVPARAELCRDVVEELDAALAEVGTPADAARGAEYRRHAWLVGRRVGLTTRDGELAGLVTAVDGDGDLSVDGRVLAAETARLLWVEGFDRR